MLSKAPQGLIKNVIVISSMCDNMSNDNTSKADSVTWFILKLSFSMNPYVKSGLPVDASATLSLLVTMAVV